MKVEKPFNIYLTILTAVPYAVTIEEVDSKRIATTTSAPTRLALSRNTLIACSWADAFSSFVPEIQILLGHDLSLLHTSF